MDVTAYHDRGCLSASKYVYQFSAPIPETIVEYFPDCTIRAFRFSKHVPHAKDLIKIRKKNDFHADIIVDGLTTTVYFTETAEAPLRRLIDGFDRCLHDAGYAAIAYVSGEKPRCDECPARHLKKCS